MLLMECMYLGVKKCKLCYSEQTKLWLAQRSSISETCADFLIGGIMKNIY